MTFRDGKIGWDENSGCGCSNDANLYHSYDGSLFGLDPIVSSDLVEVWFLVSTPWSQVCYYRHILTKLLLSPNMTLFIYGIHTAFGGSTREKWLVNNRFDIFLWSQAKTQSKCSK